MQMLCKRCATLSSSICKNLKLHDLELCKMRTNVRGLGSNCTYIVNIIGLRYPGKYPHTTNMKLSSVIDAAGGLPEGASLSEVEYIKTSTVR